MSDTTAKLEALQKELKAAVDSARRRRTSGIILSIIFLVLVGAYLSYGYVRFGNEVTPQLVVSNVQLELQQRLPDAAVALQEHLISSAPAVIDSVEQQVRALPGQMAEEVKVRATQEIEKAQPQVEADLHKALVDQLAEAEKRVKDMPGRTDQQKFEVLLGELASAYGRETTRFVTQVHASYTTKAMDIIDYLDVLAKGEALDRRQQLHRDMLRTFFILANEYDKQSGTVQHLSTSSFGEPKK